MNYFKKNVVSYPQRVTMGRRAGKKQGILKKHLPFQESSSVLTAPVLGASCTPRGPIQAQTENPTLLLQDGNSRGLTFKDERDVSMPLARADRKAAAVSWLHMATMRENTHHGQLLERIYCVDWGKNIKN